MIRHPLIVGNWKMHTSLPDAMILAEMVKHGLETIHGVDVVICPPYPWIYPIAELLHEGSPNHLSLGAQNCYTGDQGAFTGEVSPWQIKDLVKYVIVGHSERRIFFEESDELINKKLQTVLEAGLRPILCLSERRKHIEKRVRGRPRKEEGADILEQLGNGLLGVKDNEVSRITIAYEPVWAIKGHGPAHPATGEYANQISRSLRAWIAQKYGQEAADHTRILYGGSVDPGNISDYLHQPEIDGALVGTASLSGKSFLQICRVASDSGVRFKV
jgi:triosephosphate isomerase